MYFEGNCLWSRCEIKQREIGMPRKRTKNRERSLGYPGAVKPVFTKDSKSLGKRKRSLGYLAIVTPVLTYRRRLQQTSSQEALHIVRNARVQPTASSAAIQVHVSPSLRGPVTFRTI
ncbi:hypothetical protein TNCV_4436751 [Trichonephila clavipes]|nr:hypothetical protein TNCV_4436751 [Trichonephila clavipes]